MPKKKTSDAEFVQWFGPLLDALRTLGGSGKAREASDRVADNLNISDEKRDEKLRTGAPRFHNQVMWAKQYLVWEGYVISSKRGVWALTDKGKNKSLNMEEATQVLNKWVEFHHKTKKEKKSKAVDSAPETDLITDESLLDVLKKVSPSGFERVCMLLLRESGFENLKVTERSHDEGIDGIGILKINPFVSFKVLFQCKRYKGTVSRAQVGDFRNAVLGRADKGIILTTGTFSSDAVKEANRDGVPPVELVDGEKLVEMFESLEVGVHPKTVYEVDLEFFKPYFDD